MRTTEIVLLLRERLPEIPLSYASKDHKYTEGINVIPFKRTDQPSTSMPYSGTMVRVMYAPEQPSEAAAPGWFAQVRTVLLEVYPDRYRPTPWNGLEILIEDPDTLYTMHRASENMLRASLGWKPLHEVGQ